MTLEILFLHIIILLACWHMILEYPKIAIPPYQKPLEDQLEPTELNPQATWPFPTGRQP
jgi:hypothetical protein